MQFMTTSRSEAETVFQVFKNAEGAELKPGEIVEYTNTATDADQGLSVELVDIACNITTGIAAKVAGVVTQTVPTGAIRRLQVFGPANVRASDTFALGKLVVASSANATNIGHAILASASSDSMPQYRCSIVGWTLENGPNATNATVQLQIM